MVDDGWWMIDGLTYAAVDGIGNHYDSVSHVTGDTGSVGQRVGARGHKEEDVNLKDAREIN